jgi:tetratricopeptide (TPR) repeat protein
MNSGRKRRVKNSGRFVPGSTPSATEASSNRTSTWPIWVLVIAGVLGLAAWGVVTFTKTRPSKPRIAESSSTKEPSGALTPSGSIGPGVMSAGSSTNLSPHSEDEGEGTDTEKAVRLISLGNQSLSEGRFEEAIAHFKHSLIHEPGAEDTHYNLGIALGRSGKIDEAIEQYREALRILPDYAEAHNNLGNLLVKQGKFSDAIEHFKQSLELNPDSASTYNNLGTAMARQGKVTDATVHFAKAVQLQPNYLDARFNLGNSYAAQGRTEEAIIEFNAALKIQPDFSPAISALAKARQKAAEGRK